MRNVGEIVLLAYDFAPAGFLPCEGPLLPLAEYAELFDVIGTKFGGDGRNAFKLPDYRGSIPAKGLFYCMAASGILPREGNVPADGRELGEITLFAFEWKSLGRNWVPLDGSKTSVDSAALKTLLPKGLPNLKGRAPAGSQYAMAMQGNYPSPNPGPGRLPEAFVGEVRLFAYDFVPGGWYECDGRALAAEQEKALFSLVKNTFGGDAGKFKLPDLRSSAPAGLKYGIAKSGAFPPRY